MQVLLDFYIRHRYNDGMKPLYILDAYGLIYSSYYAFISRPLTNPQGQNISAIFGFFRSLFFLWDNYRPEYFVCAFDSATPTFRHEMYDLYKANRQKAPEDLHSQIPLIFEILGLLGVPTVQADGFEADDLIASLARCCREEGRPCFIVSKDKDLLQLVDETTTALRPDKDQGFIRLGPAEVRQEWGIEPAKILDFLSLTGDSSDNIPGVPGVGEKTALKLLLEWSSFDNIWQHLAEIKPDSLRAKLEKGRDSAMLSRKLVTLAADAPLQCESLDRFAVAELNRSAADQIFLRESMKSLLSTRSNANQAGTTKKAAITTPKNAVVSQITGQSAAEPGSPQLPEQRTRGQTRPKPEYNYINDSSQLDSWIRRARAAGAFAFDCETDSLDEMRAKPVGFSLSIEPGKACYVPLAAPDIDCIDEQSAKDSLKSLLEDDRLQVIGQNLKFDFHIMENWGIRVACRPWDTMIAAWLLDPERSSYKLENLADYWLGFGGMSYKEVLGKNQVFSEVAIAQASFYAAEDADITLQLKLALESKLMAEHLLDLFHSVEMPLLGLLGSMERHGILVDRLALQNYRDELETKLEQTQKDSWRLAGHEFNLNSPKQLQEVLFVERKLSTGKKTKTGYSTDVSVLEELARLDPLPALILQHRGMQKLKSTYVDTLLELSESTPRIHTHYVQTGAATGRLSSRDPNLQNIPVRDEEGRRIRSAFVAEKGHTLISADYAQIELVVFAHLSDDEALCRAFLDGADVHRRTASLIFNIKEADISPMERRAAKTINFGIIYGMGAFRLAQELSISRKDAQNFIDAYFKRYHGVAGFIQKCIAEAREKGCVETILGRKRPIANINSRNANDRQAAERVAVNSPIQGSAADIMKLAMLRVDKMLRDQWPEARFLLQVHDEMILEVPDAQATAVAKDIQAEMEKALTLRIPLRASVELAKSWGDIH